MAARRYGVIGIGCVLVALLAGADLEPAAPSAPDFGYEGTLEKMDARLAPDLREGLVLSGVYSFSSDSEVEDIDPAAERAVYPNVVSRAEATFDLNHVWIYGARAGVGDSRLELEHDADAGDRTFDLYAVTLPLEGPALGEDGWKPRWLQLWLYGPDGEMLGPLRPQPPPETFTRGWWRITFWNEGGTDTALAEGRLTASGVAGEPLTPSEQIAALEGVVTALGQELDASQRRSRELEAALDSARRRMEGLQSTIDLLIAERENLREEVAVLRQEAVETPESLNQRIAELEAGEALWSEKETAWRSEQRVLAEALAQSETENARLQRAFERVQAELVEHGGAPVAEEVPRPIESPPPPPPEPLAGGAPIAVIPSPAAIVETVRPLAAAPAKPAPVERVVPPPVVPAAPVTAAPEEPGEEEDSTRMRRPAKFRRGGR